MRMKYLLKSQFLVLFFALLITLPAMAGPAPAAKPAADVDTPRPDLNNRRIPQDQIKGDIDIDAPGGGDDDSRSIPSVELDYLGACDVAGMAIVLTSSEECCESKESGRGGCIFLWITSSKGGGLKTCETSCSCFTIDSSGKSVTDTAAENSAKEDCGFN